MKYDEMNKPFAGNGNKETGLQLTRSQVLTQAFKTILGMDAATIDTIARAMVQEVAEGNADALETLIYAKKGAALFKAIDDNVKNYAYGKQYATKGENVVRFGCKVEPSELGVSYDYASCHSDKYDTIKFKSDKCKELLEAEQKFLKTIKGSLNIVTDDGEVVTIYEPVKKATLGYKLTIQ